MDIERDTDTSAHGAVLTSDMKAAMDRVCQKAEQAGTFATLVECYRVLAEESREVALAYIRRRIKEESTK